MKYETILAMPDSKEKFLKLERKLLKLQNHGATFFKALDEYNRLHKIYRPPIRAVLICRRIRSGVSKVSTVGITPKIAPGTPASVKGYKHTNLSLGRLKMKNNGVIRPVIYLCNVSSPRTVLSRTNRCEESNLF